MTFVNLIFVVMKVSAALLITLAIVVFCSCSSYNKLNMQQELKQKRAVLATCCRLLIQSVSHLHVCSFCVVLLFVQEDCRVSGWPSPLWGFTMAAGSLCTFQILIPLHWSTWRRLASIKTAHRTKRPYEKICINIKRRNITYLLCIYLTGTVAMNHILHNSYLPAGRIVPKSERDFLYSKARRPHQAHFVTK